tara:strand:+ start:1245 stop:1424 length:180 start_codon:yes stop_codon:yes gene_type:complete
MSKKEKKLKCVECKREIVFFIHTCDRYVAEALGCPVCDDYCFSCKNVFLLKKKREKIND